MLAIDLDGRLIGLYIRTQQGILQLEHLLIQGLLFSDQTSIRLRALALYVDQVNQLVGRSAVSKFLRKR
ncbi:hypothetical protein D9M71_799460 [compost metagenome]